MFTLQAANLDMMQTENQPRIPGSSFDKLRSKGYAPANAQHNTTHFQLQRVPMIPLERNVAWRQGPAEPVSRRQTTCMHLPSSMHASSYSPSGSTTARDAPVSKPRPYIAAANGSATSRNSLSGASLPIVSVYCQHSH